MQWYIRTLSLFGIPLRIHPFLLVLWVFTTLQGLMYGAIGAAYFCLLYGPILWCTVLLHELGHALIALRCGQTVDHILLWPLGGLATIGHSESATPLVDLKIAVAGPLTHLPQLALWLALSLCFGGIYTGHVYVGRSFFGLLCEGAMTMNTTLLLFNLFVPCYPLDGGQVLVAALLMKGVPVEMAAKVCIYGSGAIAGLGLIYGALEVDLFLICICVWVGSQVHQMWAILKAGRISEHPLFANAAAAQRAQAGASPVPNAAGFVLPPGVALGVPCA